MEINIVQKRNIGRKVIVYSMICSYHAFGNGFPESRKIMLDYYIRYLLMP
jgi:hypothetical protein